MSLFNCRGSRRSNCCNPPHVFNRETLKWSKDPKPLVEYLRSASLSKKDVNMLRRSHYLPAANDESRTFAPSELFLPGMLCSSILVLFSLFGFRLSDFLSDWFRL